MTLEAIMSMISTVGFPIAVAGYCLIKLDRTIEDNTATLNRLLILMETLTGGDNK